MKWWKNNIGDQLLVQGRLPALQRGIYGSLQLYYLGDEAALEADLDALAPMAGINLRKKAEREALQAVLRRFFTLSPDGSRYHHAEWDRVIAAYHRGAPDDEEREERGREGNTERQRRFREEVRRRRAALSDIGQQVPPGVGMPELRALCVQHLGETASDALGDAGQHDDAQPVTPAVTSPVTPVTQPLKPSTTTQEPASNPPHLGSPPGGVGAGEAKAVTPAVTLPVTAGVTPLRGDEGRFRVAADALTAGGLRAHWTDGDLQALVMAGWSAADILARQPRGGWGSKRQPLAWLRAVANNQAEAGAPAPVAPAAAEHWTESRKGIEAKGVELGIGAWDEDASQRGRGEHWPAYRARVLRAAGVEQGAAA